MVCGGHSTCVSYWKEIGQELIRRWCKCVLFSVGCLKTDLDISASGHLKFHSFPSMTLYYLLSSLLNALLENVEIVPFIIFCFSIVMRSSYHHHSSILSNYFSNVASEAYNVKWWACLFTISIFFFYLLFAPNVEVLNDIFIPSLTY